MKVSIAFTLGLAAHVAAQDDGRPRRTTFPNCGDGPLASNTVCDRSASPAERAYALVEALTTEEKLQNLVRYIQEVSASFPTGAPRD
jgi:hypothetical protein